MIVIWKAFQYLFQDVRNRYSTNHLNETTKVHVLNFFVMIKTLRGVNHGIKIVAHKENKVLYAMTRYYNTEVNYVDDTLSFGFK